MSPDPRPPPFARTPSPARAPARPLALARIPSLARTSLARALLACAFLAACDDPAKPPAPAASARPSAAPTAAASGRAAAPAKTAEPPADGVELQKFVLTSEVKSKDPADVLESAKPGQRVYGHVTVRNRTAGQQRISLSFRVNDEERSVTDLKIEKSWSWRTWAYVTLRKEDKGELTVHVFDDHGAALGTQSIPIK